MAKRDKEGNRPQNEGKSKQVCPGCGGDCPDCEGIVIQKKGAGRPRKYCCYNCRQRASSRAYYNREFKKRPRKVPVQDMDLDRAIAGHKKAGHDGKPCPNSVMGDKNSCRELAKLYDDKREAMGLNRMYEDIVDGK